MTAETANLNNNIVSSEMSIIMSSSCVLFQVDGSFSVTCHLLINNTKVTCAALTADTICGSPYNFNIIAAIVIFTTNNF